MLADDQLSAFTKEKTGDYVVRIDEAIDKEALSRRDQYSTGYNPFNEALAKLGEKGGFMDGNLVIISGRSGHGKTLFAQNLIVNLLNNGVPSLMFSYEVVIEDIYQKFLEMGVEEKPLIYTPRKNVTGDINWVKEKIMEADKQFGTKVIVIDHLDFLTAKDIKTSDIRRNEINNIVAELKTFAVEQRKVIILLAHVVKKNDRSTLTNEDIADSRAINNLADIIFFIGREIDGEGVAVGTVGMAKLTKNRRTGIQVLMKFYVSGSRIIPSDMGV